MKKLIQSSNFHRHFDKIFLNKVIFNYFLYSKKIFKREFFDFEIGKQFHNFILKYIKKKNITIIKKVNSNVLIKINDSKFIIRNYQIYYDLIRYGAHEPTSTYIFNKLLKKGMVVLDIGANIGYFTLIASKLVGDKGKIYAFEPAPNNLKYLRKNIQINKVKNVEIVNKCVSNEDKIILLYLNKEDHSSHSIINIKQQKSIDVSAITLNKMFKKDSFVINFIKMDIEGAEMNALIGMNEIIEKNKVTYILTEVNLRIMKKLGKKIKDFISQLDRFSFKYYIINEMDISWTFFDSKVKLIGYLNSIQNNYVNLLCVRKG